MSLNLFCHRRHWQLNLPFLLFAYYLCFLPPISVRTANVIRVILYHQVSYKPPNVLEFDFVLPVSTSANKKAGQKSWKAPQQATKCTLLNVPSSFFSTTRMHHWYCSTSCRHYTDLARAKITRDILNPLAGRATFLSPTVHGRSDNIVVFP